MLYLYRPLKGCEMRKISVVLAVFLLLAHVNAAYAQACYTPAEFEAEQGLRIHSELMVIGLTCMKMPRGEEMYMKYNQFTQKNQTLIAQYESTLISHFTTAGLPSPEKQLHTLRTNLANEISKNAINMSTLSFCKAYTPRIEQALAMDQQKLRRWAQQVWPQKPTTRPVCTQMAKTSKS